MTSSTSVIEQTFYACLGAETSALSRDTRILERFEGPVGADGRPSWTRYILAETHAYAWTIQDVDEWV